MRATERLLEVIEDAITKSDDFHLRYAEFPVDDALIAIRELRRRGDTLVRREDLLRALYCAGQYVDEYENLERDARDMRPILDRLENAIGGKA